MVPVLIEAALRSLLVGLAVAVGLRVFRVRYVCAQKAAWDLVLIAALSMPLLLPITAQWQFVRASIVLPAHPMALLEELQATIQTKSSSGSRTKPHATATPKTNSPRTERASLPALDQLHARHVKESPVGSFQSEQTLTPAESIAESPRPGEQTRPLPHPSREAVSASALTFSLYVAVAAVLLIRLVLGLAATLRLWVTATPIPMQKRPGVEAWLGLRASTRVSSPLTIGSGILLPADYESWDEERLRIVLAHERSHIRQGDFYLQLLASLYAALVWFSPLGWWLKRQLADLAEAISDRAGIQAAQSRTSYAQILLEFATAPRPAALGVAMARSGSLARRIERLLNDHKFRQAFAGGRRGLVAVALVPLALFVATTMVRVQAATQSAPVASVAPAGKLIAPAPAPIPHSEASDPRPQQLAAEAGEPNNLVLAFAAEPSTNPTVSPQPEAWTTAMPEIAAARSAPVLFRVSAVAPAIAAEAETNGSLSFDRTLSVSGETQLMVTTGSGNIHVTRGSGSQIHIHGQIHVNHDGSEEQARQIAANPPIEQTGNLIRVGQQHEEHWHGISIDYQIEAPAGTLLGAMSGSGNIVDEGVGQNAKLETGSGDIRANGLQGPFVVKTGSGNITAEQTTQGDVKAETGSGNIEIKDVHGGVHARTGSGDIKATGTPSAPWNLQTGSGNVDIWAGNAPLTLDGSTGSGSVTTDHEMLVQGSLDHHHITGNLNGGGPLVRVETGSGEIHVH